jgi:hypothetical protein
MAVGVFAALVSFGLAERLLSEAKTGQLVDAIETNFSKHQRTFKIWHHRK